LTARAPSGANALADKPAHAGQKGGKAGHGNENRDQGGHGHDAGDALRDAAITAAATSLIEAYFAHELPAGYVRPQPLPPGIAKNLARGKPLPPGIAKRQLPGPLLGRLPHYEGHRYYAVGTDVVLVAAATGLIVDILVDAL
jgi:hypothetical protein